MKTQYSIHKQQLSNQVLTATTVEMTVFWGIAPCSHVQVNQRFRGAYYLSSSSLCVQTGSEAHPASCTMGTGGPFPGGKARPGRDADQSPLSSAEVVNE
jgi:hypothetical protein